MLLESLTKQQTSQDRHFQEMEPIRGGFPSLSDLPRAAGLEGKGKGNVTELEILFMPKNNFKPRAEGNLCSPAKLGSFQTIKILSSGGQHTSGKPGLKAKAGLGQVLM